MALTFFQELTLHCSTTFPSFLISALNPCFITAAQDFISSTTLQSAENPPPGLTKYYFKPRIDLLLKEFDNLKQYGQSTVEEWMRSLIAKKETEESDVVRWEQWETKGGLRKVNVRHHIKSAPSTRQSSTSTIPSTRSERVTEVAGGSGLGLGASAQTASPQSLRTPQNHDMLSFDLTSADDGQLLLIQ